jgi:hypothetical protein
MEVDRKPLANDQNMANDPNRTWRGYLVLALSEGWNSAIRWAAFCKAAA